MSDTPEQHTVIYRSADGREIRLTVPWGFHTGMIPPPHIEYYDSSTQQLIQFIYRGGS